LKKLINWNAGLKKLDDGRPDKNGSGIKKTEFFYLKIICVELGSQYRKRKTDQFVLNEFFKYVYIFQKSSVNN